MPTMPFNSKDLNKKNEKITESSTFEQNNEKPQKDNKTNLIQNHMKKLSLQ